MQLIHETNTRDSIRFVFDNRLDIFIKIYKY